MRSLPRYAFTPPGPSEYRIRREPEPTYVSTIEALVHVLGALEGDAPRFLALMRPFRTMVEAQIACERARQGSTTRHLQKRSRVRASRVPPLLSTPDAEVVCLVGEANAWPFRNRQSGIAYEDELVHWVGCRLSTGDTFECVVAPTRPLAPRTTRYVELDEVRLKRGGIRAELLEAWRGFVRETDVACFWGHYAVGLFLDAGGYLPPKRLDLRSASRDYARAKVGTLEDYLARQGLVASPLPVDGRAGRRLAQVSAVARHFLGLTARARG